jgi:HK97 gp10 family phage protein
MATVTVTMRSRIPQVVAAATAKAAMATAKAALDIEAHAKTRAPVDTGALKNAIAASGSGLEWRVDSPVHYSVYQEFGTSRMAAHPYMVPAVEIVRPRYLAALKAIAR